MPNHNKKTRKKRQDKNHPQVHEMKFLKSNLESPIWKQRPGTSFL